MLMCNKQISVALYEIMMTDGKRDKHIIRWSGVRFVYFGKRNKMAFLIFYYLPHPQCISKDDISASATVFFGDIF